MKKLTNTLIALKIVQCENGKRMGRKRLNPLNPLSYIYLITWLPIAIVINTIQLWAENISFTNPFRY